MAAGGRTRPSGPRARSWIFRGSALALALGIVLVLAGDGTRPLGLPLVLVAGLYFSFALHVLPHELGHAVVARLVGFDVVGVRFGEGRAIGRFHVHGTPVSVHEVPLAGFTYCAPRTTRWFRLRYALMVAAGPAATLAVTIAVGAWNPGAVAWAERVQEFAVVGGLIVFASSVLPYRFRTAEGTLYSDGLLLARTLLLARDRVAATVAASEVQPARTAGEWAATARTYRSLVRYAHDARSSRYAHLLHGLAWSDLMTDDPALLSEADTCSEQAAALCPTDSTIVGTRGYALVLLGRTTDGLALLHDSLAGLDDARSLATTHACLAVGEAMLGNGDEARRHRAELRRLDPDCALATKVEWMLTGVRPHASPAPTGSRSIQRLGAAPDRHAPR